MKSKNVPGGLLIGLLLIACVSAGCSQNAQSGSPLMKDTPRTDPTTSSSVAEAASSHKPAAEIELLEANWKELQAFVGEKKGKVVVVDVWSTACEPCMKEFPFLIELQKKYPDDVVAISFDVDFAGSKNKPVSYYRERVLKFLGSQAASSVIHRMCTTPSDEFHNEIKLDSIPAVYVYGRDGELAKRFEGASDGNEGVSYEKQVIPFVDQLVK